MLSIRLTRTGKTHAPHYRIVVQEKRSKLNGKTIDIVGHYHPAQADKLLVVQKEKIEKWLSQGAQPSETVTNLLVKEGILAKEKKVSYHFTPNKKEVKAEKLAEPTAEETPADEAVTKEAPTEETPAEETTPSEEKVEATDETAEVPATEVAE